MGTWPGIRNEDSDYLVERAISAGVVSNLREIVFNVSVDIT